MIKKILIPTDGYGLEDHVINYIVQAFPFADYHVISVVNTYERGVHLTNLLYDEMKESAMKAVKEAKNKIENMGVHSVKGTVVEGLPSKKIVAYANLYDIDLIAMRIYSRKSTASAHRIGSTVVNVLKKSRIPVLTLASPCERIPIKNVLLLTDGTSKTKRAENFAVLFTSTYTRSMEVSYLYIGNEKKKHHGEKILKNVEWKAKFWGVNIKSSLVGDFEELLNRIKANDIVIMGIGKKTVLGCRVGHISQFVATHSPIPIIFVHKMKERWSQRTSPK